jgi:hypothetical protein
MNNEVKNFMEEKINKYNKLTELLNNINTSLEMTKGDKTIFITDYNNFRLDTKTLNITSELIELIEQAKQNIEKEIEIL